MAEIYNLIGHKIESEKYFHWIQNSRLMLLMVSV